MSLNLKSLISEINRLTVFQKENVIQTIKEFHDMNKTIITKINKKYSKIEAKTKPLTKYNMFVIMSLRDDEEIKSSLNQRERMKLISQKWKNFKDNGIPEDWYNNMYNIYIKNNTNNEIDSVN